MNSFLIRKIVVNSFLLFNFFNNSDGFKFFQKKTKKRTGKSSPTFFTGLAPVSSSSSPAFFTGLAVNPSAIQLLAGYKHEAEHDPQRVKERGLSGNYFMDYGG